MATSEERFRKYEGAMIPSKEDLAVPIIWLFVGVVGLFGLATIAGLIMGKRR